MGFLLRHKGEVGEDWTDWTIIFLMGIAHETDSNPLAGIDHRTGSPA